MTSGALWRTTLLSVMRIVTAITLWVLAVLIATAFDTSVARYFRESGWEGWLERDRELRAFLKWPGEFWFAVACAVVVGVVHRLRLRGALFVLAATSVAAINGIIKWLAGRHRPYTWLTESVDQLRPFDFVPCRGGWEGLLYAKNLSFPSGHAALAFALASALTMLCPRGRWLFYAVAGMTAFERVWENAHWLSDSVAAAGLGIAGVHAVAAITSRFGLNEQTMQTATDQESRRAKPAASMPVRVEIDPNHCSPPYLSLVIPAYNERENIPTLLGRVNASLVQLHKPFEVIIVDDGSTDSTPQLLADAMKQYPWLRVIHMARNGGQSAAFEAGFEAARGEIIATIDADLQNDPEEIPRLIPLLDEKNVDMITGWRRDRQDSNFRRWQSRQANRIRNWISQETVNDSASSLKLYRAHAIKGMKLFNGAHRFFPTLVKMRGYTCYETPVKHSQRFAGTAKYGFRNRAVRAFVDLLAVRWMKTRFLNYQANEVTQGRAPTNQHE